MKMAEKHKKEISHETEDASTGKNPETVIVQFAHAGVLANVGRLAIRATYRLGLPVTRLDDDGIYKFYPDGTKKLIKAFVRRSHHYTSGKMFIK